MNRGLGCLVAMLAAALLLASAVPWHEGRSFLIDMAIVAALFALLFLAAFVLDNLLIRSKEDTRLEELAVWAHRNNLRFNANEDRSINFRFPELNLPKLDGDCYALNTVEGVWGGRQLYAFEYFWMKRAESGDPPTPAELHWMSHIMLETGEPVEILLERPLRIVRKAAGSSTATLGGADTAPSSGSVAILQCPDGPRLSLGVFRETQVVAVNMGVGHDGRLRPAELDIALRALTECLNSQLGPAMPMRNLTLR